MKTSRKALPAKTGLVPSNTIPQPGNKRVMPPGLVLLVAVILPGMGQVLNHAPQRGLVMVLFMLLLGMISLQLAAPDISLVGKLAGGLFIYALSVLDAYYWARYRQAFFHHQATA